MNEQQPDPAQSGDECREEDGMTGQDYYQQYESMDRCQICGVHPMDKTENPDSALCAECREKLIKYPIPGKIYAVIAVILILVAAGLLQFPASLQAYKQYVQSDTLAQQGYVFTALNNLDALMEDYPDSNVISVKMMDLAMKYGYYDSAAYVINTYLVGKDLSDYDYDKVSGYADKLTCYYDTLDAIELIFQGTDPESPDLDSVRPEIESLLSQAQYDTALIHYYLAYTSQDTDTAMKHFKKCYELDHSYTEAGAQVANQYRRQGDLKQAEDLLETMYRNYKEDSSVLRGYSIIQMLNGDLQQGIELAKAAYDLDPEGVYVVDTYIVSLSAGGKPEEAKALQAEWREKGYEFDADLDAFLSGTMTLEDYYIGE